MNENKEFDEVSIGEDELVFTTGVVSRLLAIPVWVLKQLDEGGIVSPPREKGASRLYSMRDLRKLQKAWHYINNVGVKMKGVKVIIQLEERIEILEERIGGEE